MISAFFHRGDGSPLFIRKLADAARAAGAEGAGVGVEGLEVEQVAFPLIAKAVLMQTEMPLEIESHLVHQDNSPQPKATYRGRDAYEDKDGAVPNYRAYYYYHGSRTEPPCDQTFRWVLLKHSLPVSDRDVDALRSLTGPNARPVEVLASIRAPPPLPPLLAPPSPSLLAPRVLVGRFPAGFTGPTSCLCLVFALSAAPRPSFFLVAAIERKAGCGCQSPVDIAGEAHGGCLMPNA